MTFDEQRASATQSGSSGPLERASFGSDDSGEKSLLELIEERTTGASLGEHSDRRHEDIATDIDDIDEGCRPEIDHMIMRLGGNGF